MKKNRICPKKDCNRRGDKRICVHGEPHVRGETCRTDPTHMIDCPSCVAWPERDKDGNLK